MFTWFATSKIGRWVAVAGALILAALTLRAKIRKDAQDDMELDQRKETDKRVAEGRQAASDTRERLADATSDELDSELRDRGL